MEHFGQLIRVNGKATKISALTSGKFDWSEYLTDKERLTSNRNQIIEQTINLHTLL